jgi:hypothetical protein
MVTQQQRRKGRRATNPVPASVERVPTAVRDRWIAEVTAEFNRLRPLLPNVDPQDLHLILTSMLRPPEVPRRWLLRPLSGGGFVY